MFNSSLKGQKILLGVTGGIAAYKTPELVRLLKKAGAEVRVILSRGAVDFVTPLSLETVSGHPVCMGCHEADSPMRHIELARWADTFLIAPLSANRLAALAHGFADDLLSTAYLATTAEVWVAPAMNKQMWEHPAVCANMDVIRARAKVIGPDAGEQACLEVGMGRMTEPQDIVACLAQAKPNKALFAGKTIMITAGPTREPIDPVRFLSNRSSGKMGYHLAEQAAKLGANVVLVSGPVQLQPPTGVKLHKVMTAQDMFEAVTENLKGVDIFIGCAAVADYRLKDPQTQKIKKQDSSPLQLECVQNPDILSTVAAQPNRPFCVGFAAETNNGEQYALEKLNKKGIDMIALNNVDRLQTGFEHDTNALSVYWNAQHKDFPLASKADIAKQLLELTKEICDEKENRT